jgi:hypothetical protein
MSDRLFPLQRDRRDLLSPTNIPWSVAEKAYAVYAAKYGTRQSLERLAERGGFGVSEMDEFVPEWRSLLCPSPEKNKVEATQGENIVVPKTAEELEIENAYLRLEVQAVRERITLALSLIETQRDFILDKMKLLTVFHEIEQILRGNVKELKLEEDT